MRAQEVENLRSEVDTMRQSIERERESASQEQARLSSELQRVQAHSNEEHQAKEAAQQALHEARSNLEAERTSRQNSEQRCHALQQELDVSAALLSFPSLFSLGGSRTGLRQWACRTCARKLKGCCQRKQARKQPKQAFHR